MTQIRFMMLGPSADLAPFAVALANELGLAGMAAGLGPAAASHAWLGLLPTTDREWRLQTWAPDSLGASFRLAIALQQGLVHALGAGGTELPVHDMGVSTRWPDEAPVPRTGRAHVLLSVPEPALLVRKGGASALGARLASTITSVLASYFGLAGQQLIKSPTATVTDGARQPAPSVASARPDAPAPSRPAPASTAAPPASEQSVARSGDAPRPWGAASEDDAARPRSRRADRVREGRQGSRTYAHPPWETSEHLLPQVGPQAGQTPTWTDSAP